MSTQADLKYILEVSKPDQLPQKVEVVDHLFAGLDPRCDLILVDPKVKTKHFLFQKKGALLSVQLLGADHTSYLNFVAMEKGKSYLLDEGDRLEVGKITIMVHVKAATGAPLSEPPRPRVLQFPSLEELSPEWEVPQSVPEEHSEEIPSRVSSAKKKFPRKNKKAARPILVHIKAQAMLLDFFLTYALLIHAASALAPRFAPVSFHYLLSWWLLRVIVNLLFGKTIAEMLLGLSTTKKKWHHHLGAVVFLSFHDRLKTGFLFGFLRRSGYVLLILLCLGTPFFLPAPFSAQVSVQKDSPAAKLSLQTYTLQGHSQSLGVSLRAEMDAKFVLWPFFTHDQSKRQFHLWAIETKESIKMEEIAELSYRDLYLLARYGNPFGRDLSKKMAPKKLVAMALNISPLNLGSVYQLQGPFWGGLFLIKKELLSHLPNHTDIAVTPYSESLPILKMASGREELVLLFAKEKIVIFSIKQPLPYNLALDTAMHQGLLTQFYLDSTNDQGVLNADVDVLMAQDEWERGNSTALLTYFRNEAKKLNDNNAMNQGAGILFKQKKKELLVSTIKQIQKAIGDETIAQSLEEIIALLNDDGIINDRKSSGTKNVRKNSRPSKRALQIQPRPRR